MILEIPDIQISVSACFSNCGWQFHVDALAPCTLGPCEGLIPLTCEEDLAVDNDNDNQPDIEPFYCQFVEWFDMWGCMRCETLPCVDGIYGRPQCVLIHEREHYRHLEEILSDRAADLLKDPAFRLEIDCDSPDTTDCSLALTHQQAIIEQKVRMAYIFAVGETQSGAGELRAMAAADDCNKGLITDLCIYALNQGWTHCALCP